MIFEFLFKNMSYSDLQELRKKAENTHRVSRNLYIDKLVLKSVLFVSKISAIEHTNSSVL